MFRRKSGDKPRWETSSRLSPLRQAIARADEQRFLRNRESYRGTSRAFVCAVVFLFPQPKLSADQCCTERPNFASDTDIMHENPRDKTKRTDFFSEYGGA